MEALAPKAITELYVQGGAALLLVVFQALAIVGIFKFILKPLWEDNKTLREKVLVMNEQLIRLGESSRATNETNTRAFIEQSNAMRDVLAAWRSRG